MFNDTKFNQNINDWDVSKVTDIGYMFGTEFNQPLDLWDVSNVTDMAGLFGDSRFNQDISAWNVSSVTSMQYMFSGATNFNQDLGSWDVSSVSGMTNMFFNVTLSPANYDSLLQGWSSRGDLQQNVSFYGGNSVTGSLEGSQARASLRSNFGWMIADGDSP